MRWSNENSKKSFLLYVTDCYHKRRRENIILASLEERHSLCIFKLCYLPMKSPGKTIPFLWKQVTPLPTSCKLSVLSKNTPAYYELLFPKLKFQYLLYSPLTFPWASMILFAVDFFPFLSSFLFCFPSRHFFFLQIFALFFFGTARGDSDCQRRDRMSFLDYGCIWLNSLKGR